jgi:hypothetical protein
MKKVLTGVVCGMLLGVSAASAQTVGDCNSNGAGSDVVNGRTYEFLGGQVNGAGATLFVDFFTLPFLFNDAIDVDGDCIQGFNEPFIPQANLNGFPKWDPDTQSLISVDNLVDTFSGTPGEVNSGWWGFTYRSVGSVNGFSELISSELCGDLNTTPPSEEGIFNLFTYFDPDAPQGSQAFPGGINASGVPFEICEMTFAFLDVPGVWGAQALAAATPSPFNTPGAAGYGQNERVSAKGQSQKLASLLRDCDNNGSLESALNTNTSSPDENTLFDVTAAWLPVAPITNRGTGLENIKYSELQYAFLTGRLPNGLNIVASPRDAGSGTRNAFHNSIGLDASFGGGDNASAKTGDSDSDRVGRFFGKSHRGGSSRMEGTVQNSRLGLGYTGLAGSSRSARDANLGRYEVLATWKDVGVDSCASESYVFPTINTVLDNCDPCTGYQIAGSGSFVVRGNINVTRETGRSCSTSGFPCLSDGDCRSCSISGTPCQSAFDCPMGETCDMSGETCIADGFCTGGCEDCSNGCPGSFCSFTNTPCIVDGDCPFNAAAGETCEASTCGIAAVDNKWERPRHPQESVPFESTAQFLRNLVDSCDGFASPSEEICAESQVCSLDGAICVTDADCAQECSTNGVTLGTPCTTDGDCVGVGVNTNAVCAVLNTCTVPQDCTDDADCHLANDICLSRTNSPCQALATNFFLIASQDCTHDLTNPTDYFPTPGFNQSLQDFIRSSNNLGWGAAADGSNYAFGGANDAGLVPARRRAPNGIAFSDGQVGESANAPYVAYSGSYSNITAGALLPASNALTGDFDFNGVRSLADADDLVSAVYGPRAFQAAVNNGSIPEVMGDFNGDGSLDKEDLRYWADGLAISGGVLDRKAGAIAIDAALVAQARDLPWADTNAFLYASAANPLAGDEPVFAAPAAISGLLATGATYENGDFRGDVAGRPTLVGVCSVSGVACMTDSDCAANSTGFPINDERCIDITYPQRGAEPTGWDGKVDAADIDYVCQNITGSWANIDEARSKDLSCDMDGDLDVTFADVTELVEEILETAQGDANLDGTVDAADSAIVNGTIAAGSAGCNADSSCGWADGDFTCDGVVDAADAAFLGLPTCAPHDVNCSGTTDVGDIGVIANPLNFQQAPPACDRADINASGTADVGDIGVIANPLNFQTGTGPCTCTTATPGVAGCP